MGKEPSRNGCPYSRLGRPKAAVADRVKLHRLGALSPWDGRRSIQRLFSAGGIRYRSTAEQK